MKSIVLTLCLALVVLFETACPGNTPFGKAANVGLKVTDILHVGADTVDRLRLNGSISVEEEKVALNEMSVINDMDTSYGKCVSEAHLAQSSAGAFVSCAETFLQEVKTGSLLTDLHIKNEKSQQTIVAIGQTVVTLLTDTVTGLQRMQ